MDYETTLEELEQTIDDLQEENKTVPIIVEGKKDVNALRKLGITGKIIPLNTGASLSSFCDQIAQHYHQVILLTDWDRKGGHLFSLIKKHLKGRTHCIVRYREVFATRSMIRTLEGLPAWMNTLKQKINVAKQG
ncbi:MAG: toprim domain-containing protein [Methanobacteriota archaeon]